jgi:signal transduction histidine kinase
MQESYDVMDAMVAFKNKTLSEADEQSWQYRAEQLQPDFRANAVKQMLKAPSNDNLNFLMRSETEYRHYIAPLIDYFSQRVNFFGGLGLALSIVFTAAVLFYVLVFLFAPLRQLATRMEEFVHNRYTYEFAAAEPNEIGELQTSFDRMAQQVLSQIEELKALDKAKSEFLSIASHELRTPLTSIKGSLALLNSGIMGKITEAAQKLMGIALEETDRLIRLINELLDLAKIEARQFPMNVEWVNAEDFATKTFQGLSGFSQTAGVPLKVEPAKAIEIHVDRDRLQQVLTNLLSNAMKYSPKGEAVTVRFVEDMNSGMLLVEVSDKGRGIAPEDQAIIFEKFRQASSPQNPLVKGTGLGLAIAKALVEQHGGTIGVRSRPGEGSTFYFTLPKWRRVVADAAAVGAA